MLPWREANVVIGGQQFCRLGRDLPLFKDCFAFGLVEFIYVREGMN